MSVMASGTTPWATGARCTLTSDTGSTADRLRSSSVRGAGRSMRVTFTAAAAARGPASTTSKTLATRISGGAVALNLSKDSRCTLSGRGSASALDALAYAQELYGAVFV